MDIFLPNRWFVILKPKEQLSETSEMSISSNSSKNNILPVFPVNNLVPFGLVVYPFGNKIIVP